ncbi:DNA polymerase III subunit gamma/tau [Erythrobacter citreus]|uniref:DNA polymerase III subunit gamma/tau n=1 Tax=Qipengyuania citrea TaxID=225971 RepID=A0A6I4UEW1_9SPHN|nr:DNA polymerase III subunit gamma/tau [Qipengyuania citrea]MDQ0564768.1 DNA polymerase-3 subunit gamma/tau [Qipengyuania citrea]MXP36205.1 DNA polymerase III subunit gamma/tau [Qipengyuania citrea]
MGDSPDNPDRPPWDGAAQEVDTPSAADLEKAGQEQMFGGAAPQPAAPVASHADSPAEASPPPTVNAANPAPVDPAQPYRVLARKYRPQTFAELIGQEAMVRTLANAIARNRLAHAFLMTGVRGVGKTSTARLIAKALNCVGPDGQGGPTISPCGVCEPCRAIAEGRHIDVIEMDAASHTGVDDVREIIEAVRYAAVSARYKIYIIDEVHMLSRNAFNALLKTLEEPPAHVKFLFATTEVEKLPVTVLSRTQRFDLRRIPSELLEAHFASICEKEGVEAEAEALHIVANAAEGSVRDGLSILDQAIAHADLDTDSKVTAARVRDMLGLADKSAQRRLFGHMLEGEGKALLEAVDEQYALGVEPLALLRAQMDVAHRITVAQVSGNEPEGVSADEREQLAEWAAQIPAGQLHRLWQLLLKGHEEVRLAPDPLVALRMALLRTLHAGQMPDPGKLARKLETLSERGPAPASPPAPEGGGEAAPQAALDWKETVDAIDASGMMQQASVMRLQVRVVEFTEGTLRYGRDAKYSEDIAPVLRETLHRHTGKRWTVEEVPGGDGAPSLVEVAEAERDAAAAATRAHPLVRAALDTFPEAELIEDGGASSQRREIPWSRKA